MWLSSLHRITGLLLSAGAVVLGVWLIALASGPEAFAARRGRRRRGLVQGAARRLDVLFLLPSRRMACGISFWDAGYGFDPQRIRASGWTRRRRDGRGHGCVLVRRDLLKDAPMSLMTPLNRVLGLGTAKGAGEHWWLQRVTAVALLPLGLWLAYSAAHAAAASTTRSVSAWVQRPLTSILLILLVVAVGYHSALGVQVVIEDYVTGKGSQAATLMASTLAHVGLTIAAMFAVLKIAFGS